MKLKQLITVPRIIGIILIVLAIIAYRMNRPIQSSLAALAGLALLLAPNKSAKERFKEFITSFRLKTEYAWIMFIDATMYVACALLFTALYAFTTRAVEKLQVINIGELLDTTTLSAYNELLSSFFTSMIIALAVFYLLCITLYTISRGIIWPILLKKPIRWQFFLRFGLLNLLWCTVWAIVAGFFIAMMKLPIAAVALLITSILLYTHLTTVLHYSYTKNLAFGKAISEAFSTGLGRIASFIQPYCYILIIYTAISTIYTMISTLSAQKGMLLTAAFILFFAFMGWYRLYMRDTLRRLT